MQNLLLPATVALLISGAGFGVLTVFWLTGSWDPALRSLWSFRAATLGDALLLPISAACLVYILQGLPPRKEDMPAAALAFLIGAALFALLIASWLLDAGHELNWTMPRPHTLNTPGYYHSVFGPTLSGVLAALFVLAFRRTRAAPAPLGASVVIAWVVAAAGLIAFTTAGSIDGIETRLVATDALFRLSRDVPFIWPRLDGCVLLVAALFFLYRTVKDRTVEPVWKPLLVATVLGLTVGLSTWRPDSLLDIPLGLLIPLAFLALVFLVHLLANRSDSWPLELIVAGLFLLVLLPTGLGITGKEQAAGISWLAVAWLLMSGLLLYRRRGKHTHKENIPLIFALAYALVVLGLAAAYAAPDEGSDALVLTALFVPVSLLNIRAVAATRYIAIVEDELALGDRIGTREHLGLEDCCADLEQSYWRNWISIIGFAAALLAGMLYITEERGILRGIQSSSANATRLDFEPASIALIILIASVATLLLLTSLLIPRRRVDPGWDGKRVSKLEIQVSPVVATVCLLSCLAWSAIPWTTLLLEGSERPSLDELRFLIYLIAAILLAALFAQLTKESIEHNVARIEFADLIGSARWLPRAAGLSNASVALWLLAAGLWNGPGTTSIVVISQYTGLIMLGAILFPTLLALVLYRATPRVTGLPQDRPAYASLHPPPSHVGNDHVLYSLLLLVLVVFIYAGLTILPNVSDAFAAVASPLAIVLTLFAFFYGVTEANASSHVDRERGRVPYVLLVRTGGADEPTSERSRELAIKANTCRVDIIAKRFENLFTVVGLFHWLYAHSVLALRSVLVEHSEFRSVIHRGAKWGGATATFPGSHVHQFELSGFENTRLDGNLYIKGFGLDDKGLRVETFRRDWQEATGLLEIPLASSFPAGKYLLEVFLRGDDEESLAAPLEARFDHPPRIGLEPKGCLSFIDIASWPRRAIHRLSARPVSKSASGGTSTRHNSLTGTEGYLTRLPGKPWLARKAKSG